MQPSAGSVIIDLQNPANRRILSMRNCDAEVQGYGKSWKWYQINRFFPALWQARVVLFSGNQLHLLPVALYSAGGIMGFSQILRTILIQYLNLLFLQNSFDIASVIYYLISFPILTDFHEADWEKVLY